MKERSKEEIEAELKSLQAEWAKQDAKENAKMKAHGYTHRINFWVHPKNGGDDRQEVAFSKGEPTPQVIAHLLRNSGVKDDFKVEAI